IVPGADHVTITRTEVGNTGVAQGGGGIDDVNGDYLTIRDCYIHDTRGDAIMVKGGAIGVVIERNRIENSTGTGIDGGQWTDSVWFDPIQNPRLYEIIEPVIRNNIVIGTDYAGIALYGALRPEVSNNTLINTAKFGQASIYVASNERFSTNTDPRIVNNIVTRTVSGSRPLVFITRDGFTGTLTMDHNRYNNAGTDAAFWSQRSGHELYGSFASWQMTLGLDADSSLNSLAESWGAPIHTTFVRA
ncbi:MAG: right-handed parallel beta-helix repeat-containing protein, partial [Acidimicrobiia bacterium]